NARYLAKVFSKYMVDKFIASNLTVDIVVPVPITQKALKKRGYNQAELLAKQVCLDLNLPLDNVNLIKVVDTIQQEKLSMSKRKENLQKAFDVVDKNAFNGKRVLVVDDVKTTGTTLNRISKVLKKYKAKQVYGLTAFSVREKIRTTTDKKAKKPSWLNKFLTKLKKSTKKH
ncbi:MAG: ComF family protein, partial [Clostridia bacterium]|nr:ComF family protein [Clostridia bacterium]